MNSTITPISSSFKASFERTTTFKTANRVAKKLLKSNNADENQFAIDYLNAVKNLKNTDSIKHITIPKNYNEVQGIYIKDTTSSEYSKGCLVHYSYGIPEGLPMRDRQSHSIMNDIIQAKQEYLPKK